MNGRFISYLRVSTDKQGDSGLGIEAQRKAVADYLNGGKWELLGQYVEVVSGKSASKGRKIVKKELNAALEHAKRVGATLLIAKLDRLARSVAFVSTLMESGIDFIACDMPNASRFEIHIRASLAEEEARLISERTKAALARSEKTLGGYRGGPVVDHSLATKARVEAADGFAKRIGPMIQDMRDDGLSLAQVAARLTAQNVRTARGGQWTPTAVRNVLDRLAA